MTFTQSIRTCLRDKYVTFSGRASRSEYWWFNLFFWLLLIVVGAIAGGIAGAAGAFNGNDATGMAFVFIPIGLVYLGMLLPLISVSVRRLHDRDMSGWWFLGVIVAGQIPFVGFIASIAYLVITCLKGTDGPNRFGPDPLKPAGAEIFA